MIAADVLGWVALAASLLTAGQALLSWDSVKRPQVVLLCVTAACLGLAFLLGGS
jgi:hypothetical protein